MAQAVNMNQDLAGYEMSWNTVPTRTYTSDTLVGHKRQHGTIEHQTSVAATAILATEGPPKPSGGFARPSLMQKRVLKASEIQTCGEEAEGPSEYTQRRLTGATQTIAQNPLLTLSHTRYGLPPRLVHNLSQMGISSIYPWQSACLLGRGIIEGENNLVYCAPTGGGKSLVADVLMLKKVISIDQKKAILVLPYVALVQEKLQWLRRVVEGIKSPTSSQENGLANRWRGYGSTDTVRIGGFHGGNHARVNWRDVDIAVCTIEKANSLVNTAIEDGSITDLGIIVMDELHMVNDDGRGYLMELLATKILTLDARIQVVGMSATLTNTEVLANWLNAKFYETKYRPVPIQEFVVCDESIYPASTSSSFLKAAVLLKSQNGDSLETSPYRIVQRSAYPELSVAVTNAVVALAYETAMAGFGALVFCSSRKGCEVDAAIISEVMPLEAEVSESVREARHEVLSDLRSLGAGYDTQFEKTVTRGVGFHHAGLTIEEREIIAKAYDRGVLKVIVATCSLAAGINLPARRVILHGARMGRDFVGPAMLRQMRGRAGRKGKDEVGESFLCCDKKDLEEVVSLLESELPKVESCLTPKKRGVKRALLEVIATQLATSLEAIDEYVKHTLLFYTLDPIPLEKAVRESLEQLIELSLITLAANNVCEATTLGMAIVASSLNIEDGLVVNDEIQRALKAFVLDGELHVFYLFTPLQSPDMVNIDWRVFYAEMEKLNESGMRVLQYVGIKPSMVVKLSNSGTLSENTPEEIQLARTCRRFYSALQLRDLCNETPVHVVAGKYGMHRGFIQNLAQSCQGFAAGMIKFCERMGWGMLMVVLDHMRDRLKAGAKADLLELAQVTFIKSRTARVFWENGFKSVRMVAEATPADIVPILIQAQPRKLRLDDEDDERHHRKLLLKAEMIVESAGRVWDRQAQAMIED